MSPEPWSRTDSFRPSSRLLSRAKPQAASRRVDVAVDDVLKHLLAARHVASGVALVQHVPFQVLEGRLTRLDLLADAGVPRSVALADEVLEHAIGPDLCRDLQAPGEGVHAADVGVEQVDRLERLAA